MSITWGASHDASGVAVPGAPSLAAGPGGVLAVLRALLVTGYGATTLTSLSVSGGVATATVQTGHGVLDQQLVEIVGSSAAALSGQHVVTRVSPTAVQWPTTAPDGAASGTITMRVASAGWAEEFTATNQAIFRPASGLRPYLQIDDTGATQWTPTLYSAATGIGAGTDGVSSGALTRSYQSASPAKWFAAADERWFWLAWQLYATLGRTPYVLWGAGELSGLEPGDVWGSAIVTSPQYATQLVALGTIAGTGAQLRRLRNRAGTPGAIALGVSGVGQVGSYTGGLSVSSSAPQRASALLAHSADGVEGYLPGLYQPLTAASAMPTALAAVVGWLGGDTALTVPAYGEGAAGYSAPLYAQLSGGWR